MIVFPQYSRLVYVTPQGRQIDLLLDGVHVAVSILDIHAHIHLSQKFKNPSHDPVEATYTFAKQASVAVCGFEMVRGNGTKVIGKVFEKAEAKKKYDDAVDKGQTASLGVAETDDIFSISVGNIQPDEVVTINLMFSQPLTDDEKSDQVRFTFPRSYGQRYGQAPTDNIAKSPSQAGLSQPFTLECSIQQAGSIKSIACPSSHPIELSLGKPDGALVDSSIPDSHFASVKLVSQPWLIQDFILVITATGLDKPRCFAESHPSSDHQTTAFAMSFVPRFTLPDVAGGMEYIFVVDRSGSMDDTVGPKGTSRIGLVRQALTILLKGLPSKDTRFNIISFGSTCDSLWPKSAEYNQAKLDQATKHVSKMQANYGGTETGHALKHAFNSLPKDRKQPTSIFLLTDGDAWMVAETVQKAKAALSPSAPFVRVFSVGIGSGISTDTCDSVARAGEGFAIYIQDGEPMTGKCARLVRASRSPPVKDVQVKWASAPVSPQGDDFEVIDSAEGTKTTPTPQGTLSLFDEETTDKSDVGPPSKPVVKLGEPASVRSAPLNTSFIFPGTRVNFFGLVSNRVIKAQGLPKSIKVTGKVTTTGAVVELDVPVTVYRTPKQLIDTAPLIHTLAAHALITDLQDGHLDPQGAYAEKLKSDSMYREAYIEAEIVRLGTTYGLTSRHTSYVAIDESDQAVKKGLPVYRARRLTGESVPAYEYAQNQNMGMPMASAYDSFSAGGGGGARSHRLSSAAGLFGSSAPKGAPPAPAALRCSLGRSAFAPPPPPPPPAPQSIAPGGPSMLSEGAVLMGTPISYPSPSGVVGGAISSFQGLLSKRKKEAPAKKVQESKARARAPISAASMAPAPAPAPPSLQQNLLGGVLRDQDKKAEAECEDEDDADADADATLAFGGPGAAAVDSDASGDSSDAVDVESELVQVATLQQFDGHFTLSSSLLKLIFNHPTNKPQRGSPLTSSSSSQVNEVKKWLKEDDQVVATVLALAWMQSRVGDESLDLVDKGVDWIKDRLGKTNDEVQVWIDRVIKDHLPS